MLSFAAIWRREIYGYFLSPVAYATLTFFLAVMGTVFYFLTSLLALGAPGVGLMNLMFGSPFFWMTQLVTIPLLTMRLFAEERKSGTLETLLTAPVSDATVVAGKYAGVLTFYIVMWLPTLLFLLSLQRYSAEAPPLDPGVLAASYLGVFLSGGLFLAIGLLCSLATSNQIVAAVSCFGILILLLFTGFIEYMVAHPLARGVSDLISPHRHLLEFSRGLVDTRAVVFYLTGIWVALFTATRLLESRQWK